MYGAELAEIYDLVHRGRGKDYRVEAEQVADLVRARMPGARSLLDLACGTGQHLRCFAELFSEVAGLELSEPMLAVARARLPRVRCHQGDMRSFDLGRRFDVITCMFGSIGYLATTRELADALRRVARHLSPGGAVVVDPWWFSENFLDGHVSADVVTLEGRTVTRVSHSAREGDASRMQVHYLVADAASGIGHFSETHLISLFSRAQYESAFAAAGLDVEYLPEFQDGRGLFIATA
ncbi:class I SAM-dependent methyltransferase [Streptomyces griseus]|uniref:class I SAM-dependent DNA methyltransferase n=1 Tax=Streptomyces griseus TaxID=1911 RepID=UPI000690D6BE|nr:class I SAM-dependent methyltransferase [Streptomyces griseus]